MLSKTLLWTATIALFALGLGLRLYDLTDPPTDFHATRQLRGAIIARGLYYQAQGTDTNPEIREKAIAFGYSTGQYEPSILEYLVSRTYLLVGEEYWWIGRIYSSIFWIIGGIALFALARRMVASTTPVAEHGRRAWLSALVPLAYYLILPFSVQASRSFQPDPGMVMWMILSLYCLYRWSESTTSLTGSAWKWAVFAGIFSGLAVLTKVVIGYILGVAILSVSLGSTAFSTGAVPPSSLFMSFVARVKRTLLNPQFWTIVLLMLLPSAIFYIGRGGRASEYFSTWTLSLSHLLLEPGTYARWLRLVEELMGLGALLIGLIGVIIANPRSRNLLLGCWLGYLLYGLFLPYQMYTHNYYHLQLIPIIALSLAPVSELIVTRISEERKLWQALAITVTVVLIAYTAYLSIYTFAAEDHRHEPDYWAKIGELLPSDGKILALTQDYGYPLMYYGWRKVDLWPNRGENRLASLRNSNKDFEEYFQKRIQGMNYFLITSFNQFDDQPVLQEKLTQNYPIYAEGPGYLIFNLAQPLPGTAAPQVVSP